MPFSFERSDDDARALVASLPYRIGAGIDCDLCIPRLVLPASAPDDGTYARLRYVAGELMLSAAGSYRLMVNGERTPFMPLRDGDTVNIELVSSQADAGHEIVHATLRFSNLMPNAFVPPGATLSAAWCAHPESMERAHGPLKYLRSMGPITAGTYTVENPRRLVIKVSRAHNTVGHAQASLALLSALSGSGHPNLAPLVDGGIFREANRVHSWSATSYVRGSMLGDSLSAGTSSIRDGLRVVEGAAKGLLHLHRRGVLHRDVSPGNIVVGLDGEGTLIDYDQAVLASAPPPPGSGLVGTPGTIAPEVVTKGSGAVSNQSDVYSLTSVLHAVCIGRPCADGNDLLAAVSKGVKRPPMPRELGIKIPEALESMMDRGLSPHPANRPSLNDLVDVVVLTRRALDRTL